MGCRRWPGLGGGQGWGVSWWQQLPSSWPATWVLLVLCGSTLCQLSLILAFWWQVECKKAQPKEVMSPTGSARGRSRVMPYGMDAFMLGIGMLGKPKDTSPAQLPDLLGSSLEILSPARAGRPRAAVPGARPGTPGGCRELFAITTCPLVAPGKTAAL